MKPKKRENIPYLIEKMKKKNIISGLTRVIGTRFFHQNDLRIKMGFPSNHSNKIMKLQPVQRKIYDFTLNKYNYLYEYKDTEEVLSRSILSHMNIYRQWRYSHGLPCRGQRTKTNASTAHFRVHSRVGPNDAKKAEAKRRKNMNKIHESLVQRDKKAAGNRG